MQTPGVLGLPWCWVVAEDLPGVAMVSVLLVRRAAAAASLCHHHPSARASSSTCPALLSSDAKALLLCLVSSFQTFWLVLDLVSDNAHAFCGRCLWWDGTGHDAVVQVLHTSAKYYNMLPSDKGFS